MSLLSLKMKYFFQLYLYKMVFIPMVDIGLEEINLIDMINGILIQKHLQINSIIIFFIIKILLQLILIPHYKIILHNYILDLMKMKEYIKEKYIN